VPTDNPAAAVPHTPSKIEGRVTKIDRNSGMVTLQASDGQIHEFRGNDETLKDLKVGDRLELTLRQPPR
jgi:ribosomal protein S1